MLIFTLLTYHKCYTPPHSQTHIPKDPPPTHTLVSTSSFKPTCMLTMCSTLTLCFKLFQSDLDLMEVGPRNALTPRGRYPAFLTAFIIGYMTFVFLFKYLDFRITQHSNNVSDWFTN